MPMGIFHPRHVHTFQRYLKQILILFTLFISSNLEFSGRLCCLCSFEAYCFELMLDHVLHLHGADFGFHVSWNSLTKRLSYFRDLYKQTERVGYTYPCEICYQELKSTDDLFIHHSLHHASVQYLSNVPFALSVTNL